MSLLSLSNEILHQILSLHNILSPSDLYHAILTCRRLHLVTIHLLYRVLNIWSPPDNQGPQKVMMGLMELFEHHPERLTWVQDVRLAWSRTNAPSADLLFSLASKFTSLKRLKFFATGGLDEGVGFLQILDQCKEFSFLRSVEVDDFMLKSHHLAKLFAARSITTLVLKASNVKSLSEPVGVYAPTNLTTLIIPFTTCMPTGPHVAILLKCHPHLRHLHWSMKMQYYDRYASPQEPFRNLSAFSPLKATLVTLHLSLATEDHNTQCPLDFSDFTKLEALEVHEQFAFSTNGYPTYPTTWKWPSETLQNRLPQSLRQLTILFGLEARILKRVEPNSAATDDAWISALAQRKAELGTALSSIILMEAPGPESCFAGAKRKNSTRYEWEQPVEVDKIFKDVGIRFQVILRKQ